MESKGTFWTDSSTVLAGQERVLILPQSGAFALTLIPETGGSAEAQFSISSVEDIEAGTAIWHDLVATEGDQTAFHAQQTPVRAISIAAATEDCHYEFLQ